MGTLSVVVVQSENVKDKQQLVRVKKSKNKNSDGFWLTSFEATNLTNSLS